MKWINKDVIIIDNTEFCSNLNWLISRKFEINSIVIKNASINISYLAKVIAMNCLKKLVIPNNFTDILFAETMKLSNKTLILINN